MSKDIVLWIFGIIGTISLFIAGTIIKGGQLQKARDQNDIKMSFDKMSANYEKIENSFNSKFEKLEKMIQDFALQSAINTHELQAIKPDISEMKSTIGEVRDSQNRCPVCRESS